MLEDDYDAVHRYDRAPVPSLQALAPDRVVHLSSVSKSLAPALRLGWAVAPRPLVLGYAACAPDRLHDAVRALAAAVREVGPAVRT